MSGFPRKGGASGTVTSVDGQLGPAVDLSGSYQSLLAGSPEPIPTSAIGAVLFTPDLTLGNHVQVTASAAPTSITMPTVAAGKRRTWFLDLLGGFEPSAWDATVTWIGSKTTAGAFEQYMFQTVDGGTTWRGYHLTAQFSITNYFSGTAVAAASVPTPTGTTLNFFIDSADGVFKCKDSNAQLFLCMYRAATTAPTNTAVPWMDLT